ncbi:nucleotide sugar dehydrogenase [Limibacillus halophilus]|uniref:UDP-N-acetyl-D-galactosamine dehydrogenase n=1 Tax=Limibacillus halophilus TaxID=1579333 RepID=A0A839SQE3_9PROT|nr:nucleotide sugar dehydrogenase [Limibacillus halophilus]MBB3065117.1 UDP-N-acetyl-D-galactosamine dehydrogenase [Limibacillus halophilus]
MPQEKIAILGLGYVGLPVALAFARQYDVVAYDINPSRVAALRAGRDSTGEAEPEALRASRATFTSEITDLRGCSVFIITVPTPIDDARNPDLSAVEGACRLIAGIVQPGSMVILESTVYPGVTEEICGPLIEKESGLVVGRDFNLGYSPERINPGDREHRLETVTKVVAADHPASLERIAGLYGSIVTAGVHRAPSIKAAELAKVIENTQRDLNIALMNEVALICERMGLATRDVLAAARTKWNFLPFTPGLVGGHCIGVDPYYLTAKAEALGYHPEVILAGRRINSRMGQVVADKLLALLEAAGIERVGARVGILGLTFKENVPDLRNSRVADIVGALRAQGLSLHLHDALADPAEAAVAMGQAPDSLSTLKNLDALVLAVPHEAYITEGSAGLSARTRPGGVIVDIRAVLDRAAIPRDRCYWSL